MSAVHVQPPVNKTAILAIIMISYIMIVLDISIVITGLPKIHSELGFTDAGLSWVSNAYTLAFGGLLLLGARIGDILGRRLMFVSGLALFGLASLAIGLAPTPAFLIAARAVQGVGAAILAPSTLALLQINFEPGPERVRAVSLYAAAAGISASIGLVVGGVLADWFSWRVGFYLNLPVALGLAIAAFRFVRENDRHKDRLDIAGGIFSTLGASTLVFGIVHSASAGWLDHLTLEACVTGLFLLAVFVLIEWRAPHPIMPLRLFESRERTGAYLARILFLGANTGFFFFSTQFMQGVLGYSPSATGLAYLPAMIVNFVSALAAPRLITRLGARKVLIGSLLFSLSGMAWLSQLSPASTYLHGLLWPMLLIGIGQGGGLGPLTSFGVANVQTRDAGAASGLVNASHQLGSSFGLGVLIAAAAIGAQGLSGAGRLTHRVDSAMLAAVIFILLTLVVTVTLIVPPVAAPKKPNAEAGTDTLPAVD